MRILAVSRHYPPAWHSGYDLLCADVAEALRARGHAVEIATCPAPDAPAAPGVHRILHPENEPGGAHGILARRRAASANARTLDDLARRLSPDVVWVWNWLDLEPAALLHLQTRGVPLAFHFGGDWIHPPGPDAPRGRLREALVPFARAVRDRLARGSARRLDLRHATVSCEALRREMVGQGLDLLPARLCHEGLPDPLLAFREPEAALPHLVFAGQLRRVKGVETAIRGLARIRRRAGHGHRELACYGRASPERIAALEALAAHEGVAGAVRFPGVVPREELSGVLRRHALVLFPSEYPEPWSLLLLQALAAGCPIAATATGGSAEILRDGIDCRLFRPGDPDDLARAAWAILEDPAGAARLGQNAHERARGFTIGRMLDIMLPVLEEAKGTGS